MQMLIYSNRIFRQGIRNLNSTKFRHFSSILPYVNNYVKTSNQTNLLKNYPSAIPVLNIQRNFSLQGIVEWQQSVYTSISHSSLVEVIQTSLLKFHEVSGMPWWFTIVAATVMIRVIITFPLAVYQNYILSKVEMAGFELKGLMEELKKETAIARHQYKLTDKQTMQLFNRSMKKQWRLIIERDNCHPFKASLLIWLQIPIWVCTSFALRNLVYMQPAVDAAALLTFTELSIGGFSWIPNLTTPDASWILPLTFGFLNLSIIELQTMSKIRAPSKFHTILTNCFRGFAIVMVPIAASVPSCMCLYWVTSSGVGLLQNVALLSPKLRRKLGIIEAPSELEAPYNHIKNEMKQRLQKVIPKRLSEKTKL